MGKSMGSGQVSEAANLGLHRGQKETKMIAKTSEARGASNGPAWPRARTSTHQALLPLFLNLSPQKGSGLALWGTVLHTEYQPSPEAI